VCVCGVLFVLVSQCLSVFVSTHCVCVFGGVFRTRRCVLGANLCVCLFRCVALVYGCSCVWSVTPF